MSIRKKYYRSGQVMLISVLAMGGAIMGATAIAGLLMAYQIRQAADLAGSARAFAAADAALECSLYQFYKKTPSCPGFPTTFDNGAVAKMTCVGEDGTTVKPCDDQDNVFYFRTQGTVARVNRFLETYTGPGFAP